MSRLILSVKFYRITTQIQPTCRQHFRMILFVLAEFSKGKLWFTSASFQTQLPSQPQPPAHNTFAYHHTLTSDKGITDDYKFTGKTYILVKFQTKKTFSCPKKPRAERLGGEITQRAPKHSISCVFSSNKSLIA